MERPEWGVGVLERPPRRAVMCLEFVHVHAGVIWTSGLDPGV